MVMITCISKPAYKTFILMFLFALAMPSCTSRLSNERITDISLIRAEIEITQNPFDKADNTVEVTLADKNGDVISNDHITVFVNGVSQRVTHRQGLYYSNTSKYVFSKVPVKEKYNVAIKLSDDKIYFLGAVNTLREEKGENIECAEQGSLSNDFVIKWHGLKDIDELSVFISVLLKKQKANEESYDLRPEKVIKIGSNGSYTISKSEYQDAKSVISGATFKFRTTKSGTINSKLIANSKITVKTVIEKSVDFGK